MIDCSLNWKGHISYVANKVRRRNGVLSKRRLYVNTNILTQLYYSFIFPFLTYGLITWGNTYQSTLKPIVTLQKKALRIMSFAKYDEYTSPLFKKLNILKFPDLIIFHNSFFMYDYFTGKLHMYSMLFSQRLTRYIIIILDLHQSNPTIFHQPGQTMASVVYVLMEQIWNSIDESYKQFSKNK